MIDAAWNFVRRMYFRFESLIKYCLIGLSGATLDFVIYSLLVTYTDIYYIYVNILSTTVGIVNNFFLNSHFNFKVKDHMLYRFLSFYAVGGVGILITSVLLYLGIDILKMNQIAAKVLTIFIVTVVQFLLNKYVTFKSGKQSCSHK